MIKLKDLLTEYRKAVILSPSKAKKMIATIKKQERVSKVFKHRATYDGKMTTIYSIRARNKSHYSGNNPYGLDMSRDSKGGSYLIRVHENVNEAMPYPKQPHELSNTMQVIKKVVDSKSYEKYGGTLVDLTTASLIWNLYQAVNDTNKKKLNKLGVKALANIAFKIASKAGKSGRM